MCAPSYNILTTKTRKLLNLHVTQKENQKLKLTRNKRTRKNKKKKHTDDLIWIYTCNFKTAPNAV